MYVIPVEEKTEKEKRRESLEKGIPLLQICCKLSELAENGIFFLTIDMILDS